MIEIAQNCFQNNLQFIDLSIYVLIISALILNDASENTENQVFVIFIAMTVNRLWHRLHKMLLYSYVLSVCVLPAVHLCSIDGDSENHTALDLKLVFPS